MANVPDEFQNDYEDSVEFSVAVNALLRRACRLHRMANNGMPRRLLLMETSMLAESASRVSVLSLKSPDLFDEEFVVRTYQSQHSAITGVPSSKEGDSDVDEAV